MKGITLIATLACLFAMSACDSTPAENDLGVADTTIPADTATPPEDTATPPEDTTTPPEDTTTPPEDTTTPPEDTTTPPEDTVNPGCNTIAELKASADGPVELTLCDVAVTLVYDKGFYVQEASGDATNIYVGNQLGEDGAWPYPAPKAGDVLSIAVHEYGEFNGHNEVLKSDTPTITGTTSLEGYYQDFSAGTLPAEENESQLVKISGVSVTDVKGKTLTVAYGTATEVQVYVASAHQLCEGATLDIATGIITEFKGVHQVKIFNPDDDLVKVDTTNCKAGDYNWDFEDWSESDPPINFIKTNGADGFSVTQEQAAVHGGASAAKITLNTKDAAEMAQAWFMPLNGASLVTFSLWIVENDPNLKVRLVLKFYDGNKEVGDDKKYSAYSTDNADYVELSVSRPVPAEATQARAFLRLYDENEFDPAVGASVVIDDWALMLAIP